MSLRVRSVLELPTAIRDSVRARLASTPQQRTAAAQVLRLAQLREERERLVLAVLQQLECRSLASLFVREYRFHTDRRWRFDLYAHSARLAVELHGGIFSAGRHVRPKGFQDDRAKVNAATELGIAVLEYWPQAIADGSAAAQIERYVSLGRRR